jgi:hypothetical protein
VGLWIGIVCGIGSGITGFTGSLIGILSTFCTWFDTSDCINGVINQLLRLLMDQLVVYH